MSAKTLQSWNSFEVEVTHFQKGDFVDIVDEISLRNTIIQAL